MTLRALCFGCGTDLTGDTLCMVSACAWEDQPGWCPDHFMLRDRCDEYGRTHVVHPPHPAEPLSFTERQIVRRFEEAPNPFCRLCDGEREVQARLPHVQTWDLIPCPECMPVVARG